VVAKLVLIFVLFAGCAAMEKSPTANVVIAVDMSLEEFLEINELSLDDDTEISDRNKNGKNDLFIWDLDRDSNPDIVIDFNEKISVGSHGTTLGFNKIFVYDYVKNEVWVGELGKSSGIIRSVYKQNI
jgi:hypothetical protein